MIKNKLTLGYLISNISVVIGVVLVWRGIWYILDDLDKLFFGGSHWGTSLTGIIIGLVVLYLPDKDLKEIGKL
jgi:ABC-type Mn2+/Zn2+ transport system permease subunit